MINASQAAVFARLELDEQAVELMVARLGAEFRGTVSRPSIRIVVRGCLDELAGSPLGALPELGERLARQRLVDTLTSDGGGSLGTESEDDRPCRRGLVRLETVTTAGIRLGDPTTAGSHG
ncbi:hypothetical protein [Nocardia arizonensis]|uniref:hypothetical protein n=1 Tax=Nocardia arizonensis TaxID=1141647 RepID=UPI0006CFCF07|nr:hypothetical protein [Nocardia arizonensis]